MAGYPEGSGLVIAQVVGAITGPFKYTNITTATTTVVKSGAGFLHLVMQNAPNATSNTITIYDNTAASGTKIATCATPASATTPPAIFEYDVAFNTGLTIVTSQAQDLTVAYR